MRVHCWKPYGYTVTDAPENANKPGMDTLSNQELLDIFVRFGVAGLLGFLIGLEREMAGKINPHASLRDFVLFALLGGITAFASAQFDTYWLVIAGFVGLLGLLFSGYWADYGKGSDRDTGITTEAAAILTFFLGVLVITGLQIIAIALAIVTLAILSQSTKLQTFRKHVRQFELEAALKLLIITFIVLPILPGKSLDGYLSFPLGTIQSVNEESLQVTVQLKHPQDFDAGRSILIYDPTGASLGSIEIETATETRIVAGYISESLERLPLGSEIRAEIGLHVLTVMLSAIQPYMVSVSYTHLRAHET